MSHAQHIVHPHNRNPREPRSWKACAAIRTLRVRADRHNMNRLVRSLPVGGDEEVETPLPKRRVINY